MIYKKLILILTLFFISNILIKSEEIKNLSDEFDDPKTLSAWKIFSETERWPNRIEKMDINITQKGHLYLIPAFGGWWNGFHGSFIYKEIKGDFLITSKIMVKGKNSPLPQTAWNRGGLLLRKPGDLSVEPKNRKENIVHIMTGVNGKKEFVVYTGDSRENGYQYLQTSFPSQKESIYVELGLLKVGDSFTTLYKLENGSWQILRRFFRGDLADSALQIGLTGCAEPYDKNGNWLNDKYSDYDFNRQLLASEIPADVQMLVDNFRVYNLKLDMNTYNEVVNNSLSTPKLLEVIISIINKK